MGKASPIKTSARIRFGSFPLIVIGSVLLFLGLTLLWLWSASREIEKALDAGVHEAMESFHATLGLLLHRSADEIVNLCDLTGNESQEQLQVIAEKWEVDQISIFGHSGYMLASNLQKAMQDLDGVDLRTFPDTRPYFELFKRPNGFVNQPFRSPVQKSGAWMKYVGIYMPKAGKVLQLGYSVERFSSEVARYFHPLYYAMTFASDGFLVGTDTPMGRIMFVHQGHLDVVGKSVSELCATHGCPEWLMFLSPLFGQRYRCRELDLLGRNLKRGYAMMSVSYSYDYAYFYIALFAVALTVFCFVCFLADRRIQRERRRTEELRERELSTAHTIQMSELPSAPMNTSGFSVSALMEPAREVGGDFFDYYTLPDGRLVVTVADVSDKGVPAAIFMMKSRLILRGMLTSSETLAAAVAATNDRLRDNNAGKMFVTGFVGVFDPLSGRFTYVSAGHNPPILRRADGSVEWVRGRRSLVLGLRSGIAYHEETLTLSSGDRLLLYTDGVTEALDEKNVLYGESRLEEAVRRGGSLMSGVRADIASFVGDMEQSDDLTLLELEVKATGSGVYPRTLEGLQTATGQLEDELNRLACPTTEANRFMVAFDEIAGNVVRYSEAREFFASVVAQDGVVSVTISDAGRAFDPVAQVDPDVHDRLRDRKNGGLGIFMTKRLMDSVDYRRVLGRNVTTLIRKVASAEET